MTAILLRGGALIDGTGSPRVPGDVLMRGERIAAVGRFEPPAACRVIDCAGLTIAPGFIDIHSHSDLQVLANRREKADQGVTTEVVGNCGFSAFPCGEDRGRLQDFANGILCGAGDWGWAGVAEYLAAAGQSARLAHVSSLVGHGSLRVAVAGFRQDRLEARDEDRLAQMLEEALAEGACGLSTGLMYAPGSSAPAEELLRLCRVVARRDKIHATHMRGYSRELLDALDEQLDLARQSGCRLQISHLQAAGRANWDKLERAIGRIEKAHEEGLDVAFDMYPYLAGSTVITALLPQWTLAGGTAGLLGLLADHQRYRQIAAEVRGRAPQPWTDIVITSVASARNQALVGKTVAEATSLRGGGPAETILDLTMEERGEASVIAFNQSEENLRRLLTHPLCLVVSDGFYVKGRPHPRLYGAFPRFLGECCRDRGWLSLEEAVQKITSLPAQRFGIRERGCLKPGCYADVVVFDAGRIGSAADYEKPEQPPEGIRYVFHDGRLITPPPAEEGHRNKTQS